MQRLDGFLKDVSPGLALKLARAVETDRLHGGALPHDTILASLRPQLREADRRLERLPTPERLFSVAFADLLIDGPRAAKQRGRILRSSLAPFWHWLTTMLLPEESAVALEAIRAKMVSGEAEFVDTEIAAFQARAAEAILDAIPGGEIAGSPAMAALGADIAADVYDIGRMLKIAPDILQLQHALPRPIPALEEGHIATIRETWEKVVARNPDSAPYVVFAVLGRLDKPWEIMRLAGALSRKVDDILMSQTDIGLVGDILLSDLEQCVARLRPIRVSEIDAHDVVGAIAHFGRLSTGMVRELGIKREGVWGKRLMAARAGLADEVERLLARAAKDISVTLPLTRRSSLALRARRIPDLTRVLDPQKAERALQTARLVAGARPHAAAGAFGSIIADIDERVGGLLRSYTSDMIDELATVAPAMRPQASAFIQHATALTAILMSTEDAALVQRRVAAALEAQAAEPMLA